MDIEHSVEITKELFYKLINENTITHKVDSNPDYTDVNFIVANYFVVDINS